MPRTTLPQRAHFQHAGWIVAHAEVAEGFALGRKDRLFWPGLRRESGHTQQPEQPLQRALFQKLFRKVVPHLRLVLQRLDVSGLQKLLLAVMQQLVD